MQLPRTQDPQVEAIKQPPYSFEAEQSVIGGLMLDNEKWDEVSDKVCKEDFYSRSHRCIFAACKEIFESNNPLDMITLSETLDSKDQLEDCGGFAYLTDLAKNTPSAANINAYAEIVRERSVVRNLIGVANEIADAGYNPEGRNSQDLIDLAESKVFAIAEGRTNKDESPRPVEDILEATLGRIEELYQTPQDGVTGLDTGFDELNQKTAGLQGSDLIIVAARPSMGKTTFAVNMCENVAFDDSKSTDKPVLIFSLEMPAEQLMMRMLASQARVDQTKIRTGQLEDGDWARVSAAMGKIMNKKNLYIDDSSGLTPTEVRSRARRLAREHGGLSMIMVDYLQLMRVPALSDNRTLEIAEISRSLKALAKELNIPVVALSQLNRSLEQRADKRPVNSDLRESGSIEQDADLIMFLYRDEVYHPDSEHKGLAEIIIGKQRNGPIGSCRVAFKGQYSRFENVHTPTF
ncbi:replicative DNA helicase [Vibrio sp. D431a]|uniref:replicative DNA helicase n=1 Tax=Vibrio sp. D431a TaxID=2837388 RepID=UPI002555953B|nr:replicative DNA helicase [Vibrio sp. D431a]MDK9790059.1 replicative DNA helicase [Vibrio sp. D431a]